MKFEYRNQNNAMASAAYWRRPLAEFECYEITSQAEDSVEVLIYDVIGWPFNDAGEFIRALSGITAKDILVRINSPGGDVVDAFAIYNAIISHKSTITTRNESLAASAASFILAAGKKRESYGNAMVMVHNPWMAVIGDSDDLRAAADVGDKFLNSMVDMYSDHTNLGKRDLRAMMKAETWMTAKEAQSKGFIDTIVDGKSANAQFDLSMFANIPDDLRADRDQDLTERDAEKALRDAGFSRHRAKALLAGRQPGDGADEVGIFIEAQKIITLFGGL